MSSDTFPPKHLRVDWTLVIANLPAWLEWVKEITGYSDNTLAICLGVDARRVERWRLEGVGPSGGAMAAIVLLAECIPSAHDRLLYPGGKPRAAVVRDVVAGSGDVPPLPPSRRQGGVAPCRLSSIPVGLSVMASPRTSGSGWKSSCRSVVWVHARSGGSWGLAPTGSASGGGASSPPGTTYLGC